MGRRRRGRKRRILRPKKKIPNVFPCPYCGKKNVGVLIDKKKGTVVVKCGACQIEAKFEYDEALQPVDYYSRFVDKVYEGGIALIKPTPEVTPSLPSETASEELKERGEAA